MGRGQLIRHLLHVPNGGLECEPSQSHPTRETPVFLREAQEIRRGC